MSNDVCSRTSWEGTVNNSLPVDCLLLETSVELLSSFDNFDSELVVVLLSPQFFCFDLFSSFSPLDLHSSFAVVLLMECFFRTGHWAIGYGYWWTVS